MLGTINGSVTCGPHPPWTPWLAPPSVTQRTSLGWFGCLAGNPFFYQLLFFSYRQIDINIFSLKRIFTFCYIGPKVDLIGNIYI